MALALTALTGAAVAERVEFGNLVLNVGGNIDPRKLPKKKLAPVALTVRGSIATKDGTTPPPVKQIRIDFDRNGTMYTRGLPRCKRAKLLFKTTKRALKACRKALVGTGSSTAIVDFPDQAPFTAKGPLLAFNGGPKVMLLHVYARVPAPTAFVVAAKISAAPGRRWGKRVTTNVPVIAGGYGSLKAFKVHVYRRWKFRGKKRSYLLARCPTGVLRARGRFRWADGSLVSGQVARTCKGI